MKLALKIVATITVLVTLEVILEAATGLWTPPGIATALAAALWWPEIKAALID